MRMPRHLLPSQPQAQGAARRRARASRAASVSVTSDMMKPPAWARPGASDQLYPTQYVAMYSALFSGFVPLRWEMNVPFEGPVLGLKNVEAYWERACPKQALALAF